MLECRCLSSHRRLVDLGLNSFFQAFFVSHDFIIFDKNTSLNGKVEIKIFQVKCGDCISIVYQNEDIIHSIIIDSGYAQTYHRTLKNEIKLLNKIDLFIITHTDDDHIGGKKSFISELPVKHFYIIFLQLILMLEDV